MSPKDFDQASDLDGLYADGPAPDPELAHLPLTFHLGLHKTGSTWLFKRLIAPHDGKTLRSINAQNEAHAAFIKPAIGYYTPGHAHAALAPVVRAAQDGGLPIVIRNEALAGQPTGGRVPRELLALRIRRAFPRAKVILTIREQKSLILSMYGQYVRAGNSSSLQAFLDRAEGKPFPAVLRWETYDYAAMYQLYSSVFGAANVCILPMEASVRDVEASAAQLGAFIGADIPVDDATAAVTPANSTWSWRALNLARHLNKLIPQDSRGLRTPGKLGVKLAPASMGARMNRLEQKLGTASNRGPIKATVARAVGDYYAASNTRFAAASGIDVGALGYDTEDAA